MGRESLGVVGVYVWLFDGQRERIDALAGQGKLKRSEFIREAVEARLKAMERKSVSAADFLSTPAEAPPPAKLKTKDTAPVVKPLSPGRANPKPGKR